MIKENGNEDEEPKTTRETGKAKRQNDDDDSEFECNEKIHYNTKRVKQEKAKRTENGRKCLKEKRKKYIYLLNKEYKHTHLDMKLNRKVLDRTLMYNIILRDINVI